VRIHLDTDLAGDPDDVCALAMLLGWPDVEVTGITTTDDPGGRRVGYVHECLGLVGRDDIPVVGGAGASITTGRANGGIPDDARWWPRPVEPVDTPAGAALDLLDRSVAAGATIVAIGPFTNLALYELARPGRLAEVPVVTMGGFVDPPGDGYPAWDASRDWNVTCDPHAAEVVFGAAGRLTLVTLASTVRVHLRDRDLPRLEASGPLGRLMAAQAVAQADDYGNRAFGAAHPRLPDDLLNFHHDPLAVAVAAGWDGATIDERRLRPVGDGGGLRFVDEAGDDATPRTVGVLGAFDPGAFAEVWATAVERAQVTPRPEGFEGPDH
jgi:inosine-uridine nucleoside N-ribohydrolase